MSKPHFDTNEFDERYDEYSPELNSSRLSDLLKEGKVKYNFDEISEIVLGLTQWASNYVVENKLDQLQEYQNIESIQRLAEINKIFEVE